MQSMAASTSLCAHDGSFSAGLLESLALLGETASPVLLVAYDAPYPEPLRGARPIPEAFGLAMLLVPADDPALPGSDAATQAPRQDALVVASSEAAATAMVDPSLEALRAAVPTARALPLLAALAGTAPIDVVLDHLPPSRPDRPARRLRVRAAHDSHAR
jgi:hypothetical protein